MSALFFCVVIPLTHHKNSGYTELKVLGVYFFDKNSILSTIPTIMNYEL